MVDPCHVFPWHIFHPKNPASVARRYADVSRYLAHRRPPKLSSTAGSKASDFAYLTLTCSRDLLMTRVSLSSLCRRTKTLPKLIIAFDDSLTESGLRSYFSDWPGELSFYSRSETANQMHQRNLPCLAKFCGLHIFGFKLAACFRSALEARTLYADADVLWFGDSCQLMSEHRDSPILGSSDIGKAIDDSVIDTFDEKTKTLVSLQPRVCAGFAIHNESLIDHPLVEATVEQIIKMKNIGRLAEQTLIAALARTEGGVLPADHVQMIRPNSAGLWRARFHSVKFARHYPYRERPQFWIDAGLS